MFKKIDNFYVGNVKKIDSVKFYNLIPIKSILGTFSVLSEESNNLLP